MTWRTVQGDRTLGGAEATLFAACLRTMIDFDRDDEDAGLNDNYPLVDGPFEDLTPAEKYTVMEGVAHALLCDTPTTPELTAVNESAVYYVFMWLLDQFEKEIDLAAEIWGEQILAALHTELEHHRREKLQLPEQERGESSFPSLECVELEKWDTAINVLWNKILWDMDWELYKEPTFTPGVDPNTPLDLSYFVPYNGGVKEGARDRLCDLVSAIPGVMSKTEVPS